MDRLNQIKQTVREMIKNDGAHDFSHIMRVYTNAEFLCKKEKIKPELVLTAVLLHDIISFRKSDPRNKSASTQSSIAAKRILKKYDYDEDQIKIISDAIVDHSFSKNTRPKTIEGKILQDADRLDALGAAGIARVFSVGGSEGRAFYNADDPFCMNHTPDDKKWTLDHFYKKLLTLEKLMNTATARSMARKRTVILQNFLVQLQKELDLK